MTRLNCFVASEEFVRVGGSGLNRGISIALFRLSPSRNIIPKYHSLNIALPRFAPSTRPYEGFLSVGRANFPEGIDSTSSSELSDISSLVVVTGVFRGVGVVGISSKFSKNKYG